MARTTEKIPDKTRHDVYGTLVMLTFVFVTASSVILYKELTDNWGFGVNPQPEVAVNITKINENPADYPNIVKVTDTDRKEWDLCAKVLYPGTAPDFPVTGYEYPAGYDPLKYPVKGDSSNMERIPEEQRKALLAGFKGALPPEAPAADAPKPADAAAPAGDAAKAPAGDGK